MNNRSTMNGKPVHFVDSRIINLKSGFEKKLLCDGPTFTAGSSCVYSCSFCYVDAIMKKSSHIPDGLDHSDVVVRRRNPVEQVRSQLLDKKGSPKFATSETAGKVIYASPLVDVAGNMELIRETFDICKEILQHTNWDIRLLSKSNLLPRLAQALEHWEGERLAPTDPKSRIIYGVSTGTLDDRLAAAFEKGTALVSKRIESLHWLQDNGYRTFGMICPSLPLENYSEYRAWATDIHQAIRSDRCEHVWAEVLNTRGESTDRTVAALSAAGYHEMAGRVGGVMSNKAEWEYYARNTFHAHVQSCPPGKLRFLQYVTKETFPWWNGFSNSGAVLL